MSDKEEYGLEDVCISLDDIEAQLKRLVRIMKVEAKRLCMKPSSIMEIDEI